MVNKQSGGGYALAIVIATSVLLMSAFVIVLQYINSVSASTRTTSQMEAAYNTATSGLSVGLNRIKGGELNDDSFNGSGTLATDHSYNYLVKSAATHVNLSSTGIVKLGAIAHRSNEKMHIPTPAVASDYEPMQISAGNFGTCVLASKRVYCWGDGARGQLGFASTSIPRVGDFNDRLVPSDSLGHSLSEARGLDMDSISMSYASCATSSGRLYCWGEVGFNITQDEPRHPRLVNTGDIAGKWVEKAATGFKHTCAIAEGKVYCWGFFANYDNLGRGGFGASPQEALTPRAVVTNTGLAGKTVTDVSMEPNSLSATTCVVADGSVYCWGGNKILNGQSSSSFTASNKPVLIGSGSPLQGKTAEKISVGQDMACALAEGKVYCWGKNNTLNRSLASAHIPFDATAGTLLDGKVVTDIAVGWDTVCAVAEYKVYCWGNVGPNGSNAIRYPAPVDVVQAAGPGNGLEGKKVDTVDVGSSHVCATAEGWVYCWGGHTSGATGMGVSSISSSTRPAPVASTGAMKPGTGASSYPTLAISSNTCSVSGKNAFCWGENIDGSTGAGSAGVKYRPVHIAGDNGPATLKGKVSHITASSTSNPAFGCSLVDYRAYCWGNNTQFSLGDGTSVNKMTPTAVAAGSGDILQGRRLVGISAGRAHACTISGGRAYCWGAAGMLGNGTNAASSKPVAVLAGSGSALAGKYITNLAAGGDNTCATAGGAVYCWGKNQKLETGAPGAGTVQTRPYKIPESSLGGYVGNLITVSDGLSCALSTNSKVYCWGTKRRIGNGSSDNSPTNTPIDISTGSVLKGKSVSNLVASSTHACAIASGKIYCWGGNSQGQLGDGTYAERLRPTEVKTNGTPLQGQYVKNIAVGEERTCVSTDHAIYCWGRNNGSFGSNSPANSVRPIQTFGYPDPSRAVRY